MSKAAYVIPEATLRTEDYRHWLEGRLGTDAQTADRISKRNGNETIEFTMTLMSWSE